MLVPENKLSFTQKGDCRVSHAEGSLLLEALNDFSVVAFFVI